MCLPKFSSSSPLAFFLSISKLIRGDEIHHRLLLAGGAVEVV